MVVYAQCALTLITVCPSVQVRALVARVLETAKSVQNQQASVP
jgi:hypothetical protein